MPIQIHNTDNLRPFKIWTTDIEEPALNQIVNLSRLPIIHEQGLAIMPDVHMGNGAAVGSVVPTVKAIIPSAVGVDIGCFVSSTKIFANGEEKTLYQLYKDKVKNFKVVSWDNNEGIVVSEADEVKLTRKDAELVRVHFIAQPNQNFSEDCTPDHIWYVSSDTRMSDIIETRADCLCSGDILLNNNYAITLIVDYVEILDYVDDVYCLTVANQHNFLLASGAIVHNCGMMATQLSLKAKDLPDSLRILRDQIEWDVPLGAGGAHNGISKISDFAVNHWNDFEDRYNAIIAKHPKVFKKGAHAQMGTLGSGNHFIELCLDTDQNVWVMLHSGSRGLGNLIGQYFIKKAIENFEIVNGGSTRLTDKSLSWFVEGDMFFDDYIEAMTFSQDYAFANRQIMMQIVLKSIQKHIGKFKIINKAINCHHNYTAREIHFGDTVWVTRKGAINASKDQLGIIPGSMGAKSFIVKGKGECCSYHSASHGAGRRMSRTAAKNMFTSVDMAAQTEGVECRKDKGVVDEIPAAYKDIDEVIANQSDLVEVVATLKQIMCVKG